MKMFIILAALVAVALAGVPRRNVQVYHNIKTGNDEVYVVDEKLHDNIGLDGYSYYYGLSDGSYRQETSKVETRGAEDAINRVKGSYSYTGPDGVVYTINYVADENGYRAEGAHLPVAPTA